MNEYNVKEYDKKELVDALSKADYMLSKNYQYELDTFEVLPPSDELTKLEVPKYTRLYKVERIAYDKNEDNLAKLSNVYNALSSVKGSAIIIIDSDGEYVDFYIGTKTEEEKNIYIANKTLKRAILGNFPGCIIKNITNKKIERLITSLFEYRDESSDEENRTISSVNGISSIRDLFGKSRNNDFSQGIEKFIDAMRGDVYSALFIADPIEQKNIDQIKKGYEQLHTRLTPFSSIELSLTETQGTSFTKSIVEGISTSISESLTDSHSYSSSKSSSKSKGIGISLGVNASINNSESESNTESDSKSKTKGTANTKSFSSNISDTISKSESKGIQIKAEEKSVTSLLERIDIQLDRLKECEDLGIWNCAAYFIADDYQISKTAASTYQALIRGENSGIEAITINTWDRNGSEFNCDNYDNLKMYLSKIHHPIISINDNLPIVNPTSLVSGAELTIQLGLPQKSVPGVVVSNYAAFGREVQSYNEDNNKSIVLGSVFHMGVEEDKRVRIDTQSLASHTFITGSTGSGKSTTIYSMLDKLMDKDIKFLVVEPAKGEYKDRFGNYENVKVYGTNYKKMPLLKINPFSFPDDIHVLEHIDRLIEIFNVCWPMYAAMPAILKDAIERAYVVAGWNLNNSENRYMDALFPNFEDVLNQINAIMDESLYSRDSKGDYKGALCTRIKSLTNGLYGQIFTSDELSNEELFDSNVIIDLSRSGSGETKSLIMGLLVMKLQEYRMANSHGGNNVLEHVTVLEEAHNLLKRTSPEQSSEGGNLVGKSVEMLANSIAEMRTYGEGFIISDQAPGLLDMSVIRNTNTKIILRLPDLNDRELVGKSANLNDDQIMELSRLKTFVAAVYQNDWLEPVLCNVEKEFKSYQYYKYEYKKSLSREKTEYIKYILLPLPERNQIDPLYVNNIISNIDKLPVCAEAKIDFIKYTTTNKVSEVKTLRKKLLYSFFNTEIAFSSIKGNRKNIEVWFNSIQELLEPSLDMFTDTQIMNIIGLLTEYMYDKEKNEYFAELLIGIASFIKRKGENA